MPSDRTMVTELGTALGTLGLGDIDEALQSRTPVMHSLSPETWQRLAGLRSGGAHDAAFHAAWENGRAFLVADDGLRGRVPRIVEWKGTGRAPGDEVAPIDLRVDHVYLVSCKYLSKILFNVSPAHVFDSLLLTGHNRSARAARAVLPGGGDWYAEVAPAEYQALYEAVRVAARRGDGAATGAPSPRRDPLRASRSPALVSLPGLESEEAGSGHPRPHAADDAPGTPAVATAANGPAPAGLADLPARAVDLTTSQRDVLGQWLRRGWPAGVKELYAALSATVARASAQRWAAALGAASGSGEAMLWRLLRIGAAPYFVLGSSAERSLRLRIATSWDWRQRYQLASVDTEPQAGGQPRVGWQAVVRNRVSGEVSEVEGHIEVRWSHGRFGGLPEAKGYLDTPHHLVPGYFGLQ